LETVDGLVHRAILPLPHPISADARDMCIIDGSHAMKVAHGRDLSRLRRDRPRRRRSAEQRDELAALHSITSSARPISGSGTAMPSALAVLRLMISSNLVGCWTGMSAGFSPFRIRPV
jgi:hypothetical protein